MAKSQGTPARTMSTVEMFGLFDKAVDEVRVAQDLQRKAQEGLDHAETTLAAKTKAAEELRDALQHQIARIIPAPVVEISTRVRSS